VLLGIFPCLEGEGETKESPGVWVEVFIWKGFDHQPSLNIVL